MSLYDPLNSPPPVSRADAEAALRRTAERLVQPVGTPLERLLKDLSESSYRWRIRRMVRDYNWLTAQARKRGSSID
jgi:hypothetical protein